MLGKILVLAPHQDDEILGCGGLLATIPAPRLNIHYFNRLHTDVDNQVYAAENGEVQKALGNPTMTFSAYGKVNELHTFPISNYIDEIEQLINSLKPDTLLVPTPSYNQDHRVVYEAAITASRPHDTNYFVKNVLLYEQPETIHTRRVESVFIPSLFVPIDMDAKIQLFSLYRSQQRGHRTPEHLRYLAGLRGSMINCPYAEAFMVIRMVA